MGACDGDPRQTNVDASHAEPRDARPLYLRPHMLVLIALGYSCGVPLEMSFNLLPTWAAKAGWSVVEIGWLSLAKLPYSFKVLWAPVTDHCGVPGLRWLGRRRSWLVAAQLACLVLLGVLAWNMDDRGGMLGVNAMLLLTGLLVFAGATQDIVADAYRAEVLQPREFGAGASMFVTGARIASVVGGAAALIIASRMAESDATRPWAWAVAIGVLTVSTVVGMAGALVGREPEPAAGMAHGFAASVAQPFTLFAQGWGRRLLVLFLFVMLYRLPDSLGGAMTSPLLVQGLGYSTESIGWVRQGFGAGMSVLGALVGGWLIARWGIPRCLWVFGVLQALSNGAFWLLALKYGATVGVRAETSAPVSSLIPAIAVENGCGGMVACAFVAYMMSACDRRATATQYALLTSFMAIGSAMSGWASGWMVANLDYSPFYALSVAAALPGLALLPWLRHTPGSETSR
ncbi:MAG: AmpG family muropeptide MFS transporter [Planctomycetes bacterium]|nr:AmpG family muropeptide MFS transporter [Planctomycetota bacterium]